MKRGNLVLIFLMLIVLPSLVSANIFEDLFNKISGNAVEEMSDGGSSGGGGSSGIILPNESVVLNQTCTDSDGGVKPYVFGSCIEAVSYENGGSASMMEDVCVGSTIYFSNGTIYTEGILLECYCSGNERKNVEIPCEFGCENGYCLQINDTSSTNHSGGGSEILNQTCVDSDGGVEPFIPGTSGLIFPDYSIMQAESCILSMYNESSFIGEFYCEGDNLEIINIPCEFGCENGACIEPNESFGANTSCNDSDGGMNVFERGEAYSNGVFSGQDYCIDEGGGHEFYCNEGLVEEVGVTCPGGSGGNYICENGACMVEEENSSFFCTDSDGGKDYFVKGILNYSFGPSVEDYCFDGDLLFERYCSEDFNNLTEEHVCLYGCSAGECNTKPIKNWFVRFFENIF